MNLFIYCFWRVGKEVLDIAHRLNQAHSFWDRIAFLDDTRKSRRFTVPMCFGCESAIDRFDFN